MDEEVQGLHPGSIKLGKELFSNSSDLGVPDSAPV